MLQKRLDKPRPGAQILIRYTKYDRRRTTTGAPAPKFTFDAGCPCALSTYALSKSPLPLRHVKNDPGKCVG